MSGREAGARAVLAEAIASAVGSMPVFVDDWTQRSLNDFVEDTHIGGEWPDLLHRAAGVAADIALAAVAAIRRETIEECAGVADKREAECWARYRDYQSRGITPILGNPGMEAGEASRCAAAIRRLDGGGRA